MKFLYLYPKPNKYYIFRDEQFIIESLKKNGHTVYQVKNFFILKIIYYIYKNNINNIIFSSLNIGKKTHRLFKFLKNKNFNIYWWYFDSANTSIKRFNDVCKVAQQSLIFFNRDKINFLKYKNNGINPIWLDQGVPNILKYVKTDYQYDYDIGFFGSLSMVHRDRAQLLKKIDEKYKLVVYSKDKKDFLNKGFKNVKNYVFKDVIPDKVARVKIIIVLNASCSGPYYWSDRIHIMLGSGAFCLTENIEGIEKSYINKKHHILFNDEKSLFDSINHWLNNDCEREEIRYNGFLHAQKYHSYNIRSVEFINSIESLSRKK